MVKALRREGGKRASRRTDESESGADALAFCSSGPSKSFYVSDLGSQSQV